MTDHIRTKSDAQAVAEGCYFDTAKADDAIRWIETTFEIALNKWQRDALHRYFGWRRPDGSYRFTKIQIWIPKKNGKSYLISALVGYKLFELKNARVYSIAFCAKQAAIVMDGLIKLCKKSKKLKPLMKPRTGKLKAFCSPFRRDFTNEITGSKYEALADNIQANDGIIPDVLVFDEIHRMRNQQVDVVDGSTSNLPNALKVIISTAGSGDKTHRSFQNYEYAKKVLSGEIIDTQLLPIVYECPTAAELKGEAIYDVDLLIACNPVLQDSPERREQAAREVAEAKAKRNDSYWRRFRLGQWIAEDGDEYIDAGLYAACEVEPLPDSSLGDCYLGLDKSGGVWDFHAIAGLFPLDDGRVFEKQWTFAGEDRLPDMSERDDLDYASFVDDGELIAIPAAAVADEWLYEWCKENIFSKYRVVKIAGDVYAAAYLLERWKSDGHDVVAVQQSNNRLLSPVIDDYADRVKKCRIIHGRNKLVAWQLSHARSLSTAKDLKKIVKAGSSPRGGGGSGHIDNIDATLNAHAVFRAAEIDKAANGASTGAVVA
jgi:phage terminase large subunit-like protein